MWNFSKCAGPLALFGVVVGLAMGCHTSQSSTIRNSSPLPAASTEGPVIPAASLNRGSTLADLTGGELGIGGGYLIGAAPEKVRQHLRAEALASAQRAEQLPVQIEKVRVTTSADLNNDGFITLDEVLAMTRAGLSSQEIGDRLRATHYVFHLTPEQERYLTDRGVTPAVVAAIRAQTDSKLG